MTDGASALARRMNVPEIVIGLTIVACGTSAPEFFVSLMSALQGTPDLAVGNVVGSNIFNTLLIVGVSAMVAPMTIRPATVKKDIPCSVMASVLLLCLCLDGFPDMNVAGHTLGRLDGLLLLAVFAAFMYYTLYMARHGQADPQAAVGKPQKPWVSCAFILLGLACLIIGSNIFVSAASDIARSLNVSEAVIGLTIVAGGTSLPELATSVVAARKGQSDMAIGNVIGSNVFNILLILGATSVISPLHIEGITTIDMMMLLGSVMMLWLFSFTSHKVERWEGMVLTATFMAYMGWLLSQVV